MVKKNIKKKIIGLAHGVFDVLHSGHLLHFKECKKHCDTLIVSITDDKFVNKGPNRPIFNSKERSDLIKNFKFVDKVLINKDITPLKLIKKIKPDYYFKGNDYSKFSDDFTGNILKEKKVVEKNGGKLLILNTKQTSSSTIINENFSPINQSLKKNLKSIDQDSIKKFFKKKNKSNFDKKILILGEPIIDQYTYVEILGKSQKNQIISTNEINHKAVGGGTILVAQYLNNFFKNIDYLCISNNFNNFLFKKYLDRKINKITIPDKKPKITIKRRFINFYKKERLFQNNLNNSQRLSKKGENFLINKLKKIINKYDAIILFDYGHEFISDKILDFINENKDKFFINCQSNSSNFGFNLPTKYKGSHTICMDEVEFRLSVSDKYNSIDTLIDKNLKFINRFKNFIITRGKNGCIYIRNKKKYYTPAVFENNSDTTGAGDIFFSTLFFLSLKSKLGIKEVSLLSHIAAGVHNVEKSNFKEINLNLINKIFLNIIK